MRSSARDITTAKSLTLAFVPGSGIFARLPRCGAIGLGGFGFGARGLPVLLR